MLLLIPNAFLLKHIIQEHCQYHCNLLPLNLRYLLGMGFFCKVISGQLPVSDKNLKSLFVHMPLERWFYKKTKKEDVLGLGMSRSFNFVLLGPCFSELKNYPAHINIPGVRFLDFINYAGVFFLLVLWLFFFSFFLSSHPSFEEC